MSALIPTGKLGTQQEVLPFDCVADNDTLNRHVKYSTSLGLPQCEFYDGVRKGKLAIVASGPSVTESVKELRDWDGEIWGINGAFKWMIRREIRPHAFVGVDPEEMLKDYLDELPEVATYYLASQVHPAVFDHLAGRDVRLWHLSLEGVPPPIGSVTVHGGATCLTRAPWLACMLGWADVHIFGGDSSFTHKTHVYGGNLPTNFCYVEVDGALFRSHGTMMAQATDMVSAVIQSFPGKITIHGDGLMNAAVRQYKNTGVHEWLARQEAWELNGGRNRKERRRLKAMERAG